MADAYYLWRDENVSEIASLAAQNIVFQNGVLDISSEGEDKIPLDLSLVSAHRNHKLTMGQEAEDQLSADYIADLVEKIAARSIPQGRVVQIKIAGLPEAKHNGMVKQKDETLINANIEDMSSPEGVEVSSGVQTGYDDDEMSPSVKEKSPEVDEAPEKVNGELQVVDQQPEKADEKPQLLVDQKSQDEKLNHGWVKFVTTEES